MKYVKGNATITAEVLGNEVMVITTVKGVETDSKIYNDVEWNTVLATLKAIGFKEVKIAEKKADAPNEPKAEKKSKWIPREQWLEQQFGDKEARKHFIEVKKACYNEAKNYLIQKAAENGKKVTLDDINKFVYEWAKRIIANEKKAAEAAK